MITCRTCGNANPSGRKFCHQCGAPLITEAVQQVPQMEGTPCVHCGAAVPAGKHFCSKCGHPVAPPDPVVTQPYFDEVRANPPVPPPASSIDGEGARHLQHDWKTLWPFVLSGGILLIYALLTRNPTALVVTGGLAWAMRRYGSRLDGWLAPLWPFRDRLPRPVRAVAGWVAPVAVAFLITGSPSFFNRLAWLPLLGPDASVFVFTTLIAALIAYILINEPQKSGAQ
jgi:hypothetical protein